MCDIYDAVCGGKDCSKTISMHLGDYETSRDEIEVFCWDCLPADVCDGVVWVFINTSGSRAALDVCFVRARTLKAIVRADSNHPNYADTLILSRFGMSMIGEWQKGRKPGR